jgi:hypothetical protein
MNNRWNPDILNDVIVEEEPENPFDFDDKPHLRTDNYHQHRNLMGIYALLITLGLFVFVSVFLVGIVHIVDLIKTMK